MNRSARARSRSFQEGAATLVVVMMLFLIMALLAAYANRSVLFEQRMSISYSRASLSQEAAESGIEWTLAQLNGEAVDASCKPVDSGGRRFVDRYLAIDPANRVMSGTSPDTMGVVDCARDTSNNTWACRCPDAASPRVTAAPISNDPAVSFVTHLSGGTRGGTVMVNVMGCTDSVVDKCAADFNGVSKSLLGRSVVSTLVGFVSAVRNPPAAPLVVRGDIESSGAQGLGLHNADAKSGGLLAMVGGTWAPASTRRLDSIPGGALNNTVLVRDDLLHDNSADEFFKKFMGASLARYRQHPALRTITCNGDCSAAIRDAYQAGKRIMWVEGPLTISSSGIFGQVDDPIVLIASGDAVLSGAFRFNGLLVSQGNVEWTGTGSPAILTGALLVGGSMRTNGEMDIVYQQAVSDQLRNRVGSFVRVPGSWIDLSRI